MLDDKYIIDGTIAIGGMSTVYSAFNRENGIKYAVKTCINNSVNEKALRKEYKILKSLSSIYSPEVYGIYDCKDMLTGENAVALVEEYIEGTVLSKMLMDNTGMYPDEELVFNIITALCRVTYELHNMEMPVFYCDIKPDNIIIRSDRTIKIIDFGSVYCRMTEAGNSGGERFGTAIYAAPEQFDACSVIDARTDVYGIGRIFGLLADYLPEHDKKMYRVIKKCTDSVRKKRYCSIAELLCDVFDCWGREGIIFSTIK